MAPRPDGRSPASIHIEGLERSGEPVSTIIAADEKPAASSSVSGAMAPRLARA